MACEDILFCQSSQRMVQLNRLAAQPEYSNNPFLAMPFEDDIHPLKKTIV